MPMVVVSRVAREYPSYLGSNEVETFTMVVVEARPTITVDHYSLEVLRYLRYFDKVPVGFAPVLEDLFHYVFLHPTRPCVLSR